MVSNFNWSNQLFRVGKNLVDCYKWTINIYDPNLLLACVGENQLCSWVEDDGKMKSKCCEEGLDCRNYLYGSYGYCKSANIGYWWFEIRGVPMRFFGLKWEINTFIGLEKKMHL